MNLILKNNNPIFSQIRDIDDDIISTFANLALTIPRDSERDLIRSKLYKSKYSVNQEQLKGKEIDLESHINKLSGSNLETQLQNQEYRRVLINYNPRTSIDFRFYLAPDPDNMHELIKKMVDEFKRSNIPIFFKYQLTNNMESCDRLVIYSDFQSKDKIVEVMRNICQNNPKLFSGCEQSCAWLYDTPVKGLFITPGVSYDAYSHVICDSILEAKYTFDYLYGVTTKSNSRTLTSEEAQKAFDIMKSLIASILFRKGVLLSKDGRTISIKDKNVKAMYDYETGILKHFSQDDTGYHEVQFLPTYEGHQALENNMYSVSMIKPQNGLIVRHLTPEQKKEEIRIALYGNNGSNKKR